MSDEDDDQSNASGVIFTLLIISTIIALNVALWRWVLS